MEKKFDNLIKYTQGKLAKAAEADFEEQLKKDTDLAKEASFLQELAKVSEWKGLMEEAAEEMEATSDSSIDEKIIALPNAQKEAKIRRLSFKSMLAYAASIAILVITIGFWYANNNYSNGALATTNSEKLGLLGEGLTNYRNDNASIQDPFQKGLDALDTKKFAQAITFFEAIPVEADAYLQARLFLTLAQFEEKDYSAAESNAQIVVSKSQNAITRHRAEFLKLQVLLANGKEGDFQRLADKISTDNSHTYQRETLELNSKMGSFWRALLFKK